MENQSLGVERSSVRWSFKAMIPAHPWVKRTAVRGRSSRTWWAIPPLALPLILCGCDVLLGLLVPAFVEVELVNAGSFPVDAVLYYDDEENTPGFLLPQIGTKFEVSLAPGEVRRFSRSCDDLRALVLDDADLRVLGGSGPEANSDVLRIEEDFDCGEQVLFTFTHSSAILDFDVSIDVAPQLP